MFILIGATVFSFTFNAADGHVWVEHLFAKLPGRRARLPDRRQHPGVRPRLLHRLLRDRLHRDPAAAPVADKLGIDLIWFGVIIAMNLQTSFLTPPFGFALFYLRSVAAPGTTTRTGSDRRNDTGGDDRADLQGRDRLHRHPARHGGRRGRAFPNLVIDTVDQGGRSDLDKIQLDAPTGRLRRRRPRIRCKAFAAGAGPSARPTPPSAAPAGGRPDGSGQAGAAERGEEVAPRKLRSAVKRMKKARRLRAFFDRAVESAATTASAPA